MRRSPLAWKLLVWVLLVILLGLTLYPFLFMVQKSVQSNEQIAVNFWGLEDPLKWGFYARAWEKTGPYIWNSVKVSTITVAGVLLISSLSAFCFARLRFPGKEIIYYAILGLLMVPDVLTLVTRYILVGQLHLLDSHWSLILPGMATLQVFGIFILRGFFEALPEELFEAARIDGASELTVYLRIVLPLSRPILGTVAILSLLAIWNDYIWPSLTLNSSELFTIPVGLAYLEEADTRLHVGQQMAGYTLSSIPLLILFFLTMRTFIKGFTAGAIKA